MDRYLPWGPTLTTAHDISSELQRGEALLPVEVERALEASLASGERLIWYGRPSDRSARHQVARPRWGRAAILGGGYSVVGGFVALLVTGDLRWLALPLSVLALYGARLWLDRRQRAAVTYALAHTGYGLTTRQAVVVQTRPALQRQTIALADVELTNVPGAAPGLADIIFQEKDGRRLAFSGIEDAGAVESLANGLRTAPEAIEQQIALIAQWAEIGKQLG